MNLSLVGAFVLVLGVALITGVLWLASGGAFQKKYDLYLAVEDESVAGLNVNAPVKYNGVDVGKVREIHLDKHNPERVILLFAIERGTPIKEDTVAVLKTQGITGIVYVELNGGAANAPPLRASANANYPVIRTKPSFSARLENVLTNVLAKLDNTSNSINALLDEDNRAAFKQGLADMATLTHTLAARQASIDAGITHAAQTLDNTARATEQLEAVLARIGRSAGALETMGQAVANTSNSAAKTVDTVGLEAKRFSAETRPEFERLLSELSLLSTSLRRLSEQTERDPGSLLFGHRPAPLGPGESGGKP